MLEFRELIDELTAAWKAGDALRASAFFAPDALYQEAGREPTRGREAIAALFTRFFRDGPAWRFEIEHVLVEGERAAVVYTFAMQVATGWQTRAGCALVRREGGSIAEWREYHG